MTWDEFRNAVDEELRLKGLASDIEIHYIDTSQSSVFDLRFQFDDCLGMMIT